MAEVGIKELKNAASRVIDRVACGERFVVTKRGRPVAVILPMDVARDFVIACVDDFVADRSAARQDHRRGRSLPFDLD